MTLIKKLSSYGKEISSNTAKRIEKIYKGHQDGQEK